jgi:threonine dehydrogenase-like Zn-dependent dehydrogenase
VCLGLEGFVTHRMPLTDAAEAYAMFQAKRDGAITVVLSPGPGPAAQPDG